MATGEANNIKSSTFDLEHFEHYQLCVQFGLNQLTYCLINNTSNNIEYFNNIIVKNDIVDIINNDKILKLNFASSSVSFVNFPFTLVPNEFYKKENLKDILELTSDVYDIIKSDLLTKINSHIVYSIPSVINDIALTFFPNAKQSSQQKILIEQFSKFENKKENAYLYIDNNIFNLTIFKNKNLIFNNSFFFENKEDIIYFTLFSFEQHKIDTEIVDTTLYGKITKGDKTYRLLYDYIRYINIGSPPNHLRFSSQFDGLKKHEFYPLFSQYS